MLEKQLRHWSGWIWLIGLLGGGLGSQAIAYFWAEGLWFQDIGYGEAFRLRASSQILLWGLGFVVSFAILWSNLALARRLPPLPATKRQPDAPASPAELGLLPLLVFGLGLGLLLGLQMVYIGRVVASYWSLTASVYSPAPPLPLWAKPAAVQALFDQLVSYPWQLVGLGAVALLCLVLPQLCTAIAAVFTSVALGLVLAEQWTKVLVALRPSAFGEQDPLFQNDISYYLFRLPFWEVVEFWLISLVFFLLVSLTLIYLLSGNSLSNGRFQGFSPAQQRHLYGLGGVLMLATSLNHWLGRFEILYSPQGVVYGASYTDVQIGVPVYTALSLLALFLGTALLWRTVFWKAFGPRDLLHWLGQIGQRRYAALPPLPSRPLTARPLIWGLVLYGLLAIAGGLVVPGVVQRLVVQPNELQREIPFIGRSINLTRRAFDLQQVNVEPFQPEGGLTTDDLRNNPLTLDNVRLWDTRPLLESNRQLQQIRLYYEFFDADVDRYTLTEASGDSQQRQVLISARELNYGQVPAEAQTWVNEHLVYTHGYGFTMSPVNTATEDGLPSYFVRDIAHTPQNEAVRRSIPIGEPRIYFGELTNTYVMVDTQVRELDYPSGDENVYTTYAGPSGISLKDWPQRLLFAWHLRDWQMLFTEDFTPDTRLLFRRRITERVEAIAPFLRYDSDPYLVIADTQGDSRRWSNRPVSDSPAAGEIPPNYLYWIIDAYTTSDRYPYSDPLDNDFNYIRNSVKVVIDAYSGAVRFFIVDPEDPIIQTWSRLLPGMFYPLEDMPAALQAHLRYPKDFYQVQSRHLMTYHMTDPQVFYNREDQWRAPNEIYGNEAQRVEPYYLIMRLPNEAEEEFILLQPFTPAQRNNLVAWLAASSDADRNDRMLLYRFPKQELVFGPEQIEARINQDPAISQRISLWNTEGSRAIQGNLLVIPIESSLLYVEPLYLEAEQNSVPTLARVILVYQNRIAMAETFGDALVAIFEGDRERAAPVLRELEGGEQSLQDVLPDLLQGETAPPEIQSEE